MILSPASTVWVTPDLGVAIVPGDQEPWTETWYPPAAWVQYDKPCDTCLGRGWDIVRPLPGDGSTCCPDCQSGRQVWELRTAPPIASFDVGQATDGAALIATERRRQVEAEGWTPDHDAEHADGALARAAIVYAAQTNPHTAGLRDWWPWDAKWLKISDDPVRNLVKAGALIAAEIDRIQCSVPLGRFTLQVVPVLHWSENDEEAPPCVSVGHTTFLGSYLCLQRFGGYPLNFDPLPTPGRDFAVIFRKVEQ